MKINKNVISVAIGVAVFLGVCVFLLWFGFYRGNGYEPRTNEGQRWRVGYYEGGSYKDYQTYLLSLIKGLVQLRWLPKFDPPPFVENDNTRVVWDLLVATNSRYIEFVEEAYWSSDWYEEKRTENKAAAIKYLQERKLDLIIAGGTWAGLDLANNDHGVPVVVISASEPVKAGIIESAEDSGFNHVHAAIDPTRYQRQIRAFYNIVGFDKVGVVYEDTPDGKIYAALPDLTKMSVELGFDIVSCIATDADVPEEQAMQGVLGCHEELAQAGAHAVYVTAHRGVNPKWMPGVLQPLFEHKISTFAQEGPDQVRRGVMLSIARIETDELGMVHARAMAQIFNGKRARDISQIYEEKKRIVINLKTAELIEFEIPDSVVKAADRTYNEIATE